MIRWLRLHMPLDGRGWAPPDGPTRRLFAVAASSVRRRLPAPVAGPVLAVARVGWLPVALVAAWRFARRRRTPLRPLFIDCLMAGAWPGEAYLWRELFGRRIELGGRALSLLLPRLGEDAGRKLLADKDATAQTLRVAGAPVPQTLAIVGPGCAAPDLQTVRRATGDLVIKPQFGHGSQGLIMASPLAADRWRVDGAEVGWDEFSATLQRTRAPLVVQPRLQGAGALAGFLDAERPPVLRITTARRPGGAPFVHSALLAIPVPGNSAADFATKDLRAPVDPASGRLGAARLFARPRQPVSTVPWNGAIIEGRAVEGVAAAAQATLLAAAAIPPLPIISWDVVLTDAGPVILEGNTIVNWVLANYGQVGGDDAGALLSLLAEWAAAAEGV